VTASRERGLLPERLAQALADAIGLARVLVFVDGEGARPTTRKLREAGGRIVQGLAPRRGIVSGRPHGIRERPAQVRLHRATWA
jgi:hypothetical protein